DDDLLDEVLDREHGEHERHEHAADEGADEAHEGVVRDRREDRGVERAEQQLALDRDVDDADALADHAAEAAEDERHRERQRAREQAHDGDHAARARPGEEAEDAEGGERDRHPDGHAAVGGDARDRPGSERRHEDDRDPRGRHGRDRDVAELARRGPAREAEDRVAGARGGEGEQRQQDRRRDERDRQLPGAHAHEPVLDGRLVRRRGRVVARDIAHRATAFFAWRAFCFARFSSSDLGRKKIVRTSGGAATNSTTTACTTSTMSTGMPSAACIVYEPALSAPNSRPATTVPHALLRPSSATVMASKPKPASIVLEKPFVTAPWICCEAARPARPPAKSMA